MGRFNTTRSLLAALGLAGGLLLAPAGNAFAQEEPAPDYVSGVIGIDWYSHFISYGGDVWGGGNDFGENSTINPYAEVAIQIGDFNVFAGTWWDLNDNATNSLGGNFQEVDVWVGVGYGIEEWSFSLLYQSWNYGGGTEEILDFNVGFDDTGLLIEDFAFNPSLTIHNRIDASDGLAEPTLAEDAGTIIVVGIEPGFSLYESDDFTIDMSVPVSVGFSLTENYFGAGGDDGYAFTSVGVAFSMPLTFIPEGYGAWALNAGLTYYFTEGSVYPGNVDDEFLVANAGLSLAF